MILTAKTKYKHDFAFYHNDTIIGQSIMHYGEYTETELDVLRMFLDKRESVVYDIGANIGYHTVGFAHYAKEVHSFEPNDKNYALLEKNTNGIQNVKLYHVACSDVVGDAFITDFDIDGHGNYGECMMSDSGQPCKTIRIDDLALPTPTLIKIDVEGHELRVFEGAKQTIRQGLPVIFYETMHGSGFDLIYDFLVTELSYKIYFCPSPNYNPYNFNNERNNIFGNGGVLNSIAIPYHLGNIKNLPQMISRDDTYEVSVKRYLDNQVNK